jgi:hypothetical protein
VSWLVPEVARRAVDSIDFPALANGAGVVVLVLLMALLVEAQLAQAYGAARFRLWPVARVLVVPLLLAFAFVVGLRIADVLRVH